MKMRHRIISLLASASLACAGLMLTAPSAHAVACGDQESDWTGLVLSTWNMFGDVDDVDFEGAVILTKIGNTSVVQDSNTLDTYTGFYDHQEDENILSFTAETPAVGNPFESLAFIVEATACTGLLGNRVDAADGMIVREGVGRVGSVELTRVL